MKNYACQTKTRKNKKHLRDKGFDAPITGLGEYLEMVHSTFHQWHNKDGKD